MKNKQAKHYEKREYFSLRKFKQGLASVTIGAALFASVAYVAPGLGLLPSVVYAAEETYALSSVWNLSGNINTGYVFPEDRGAAYSSAQTTITTEDGKSVGVTASIGMINTSPEGTAYLVDGTNQARYRATSDMFVGNPTPSQMPALGIFVQPSPSEGGGGAWTNKYNFNGVHDTAEITFTFDQPVTDPILDLSGIGGNSQGSGRGSFNNTVMTLLTRGVTLEKASEGANLSVSSTVIQVNEKNTDAFSIPEPNFGDGTNVSPNFAPAGTGSVRLKGTFTSVTFKLSHQAIPYSAFSSAQYNTGSDYFRNDIYLSDGINGLNKHWSDNYTPVGTIDNSDLFRVSFRLPNQLPGSVEVQYVDTEGNVIGTTFKDTDNQPSGTAYDTTADTGEVSSEQTKERPSVITKDGKTYKLVAKETTVPVGTVNADGSLATTNLDFGTDAPTGSIESGKTKKVTYVYEEVKPGGQVDARYVIEGTETEIADDKSVKPADSPVGENYTDTPPATIEKDGKTYELVRTRENEGDAPSTGSVTEEVQTITYEYKEVVKPGGQVDARYVIEGTETEIADDKSVKPADSPVGENYTDTPPVTIEKDGKTYELVRTRENEGDAPSTGSVTEEAQTITYEYKEVVKPGGQVDARYVIEGTETEIADDKSVKPADSPVGENYTDTPPATIEKDGKTYELVRTRENEGDAPSTGSVTEEVQTITYEYKEVVKPKGSVLVRYITEDGTVLEGPSDVVRDGEVGSNYSTTPKEFPGYVLVKVDETGAPSTGTVEEGEKTVTYIYKKVETPAPTPDPKTGSV
ncbi:SHS2 domain-containing protein, partial [Streptococcus rupicaprae]